MASNTASLKAQRAILKHIIASIPSIKSISKNKQLLNETLKFIQEKYRWGEIVDLMRKKSGGGKREELFGDISGKSPSPTKMGQMIYSNRNNHSIFADVIRIVLLSARSQISTESFEGIESLLGMRDNNFLLPPTQRIDITSSETKADDDPIERTRPRRIRVVDIPARLDPLSPDEGTSASDINTSDIERMEREQRREFKEIEALLQPDSSSPSQFELGSSDLATPTEEDVTIINPTTGIEEKIEEPELNRANMPADLTLVPQTVYHKYEGNRPSVLPGEEKLDEDRKVDERGNEVPLDVQNKMANRYIDYGTRDGNAPKLPLGDGPEETPQGPVGIETKEEVKEEFQPVDRPAPRPRTRRRRPNVLNRLREALDIIRGGEIREFDNLRDAVSNFRSDDQRVVNTAQQVLRTMEGLEHGLSPEAKDEMDEIAANLMQTEQATNVSFISSIPWMVAAIAFGARTASSKYDKPTNMDVLAPIITGLTLGGFNLDLADPRDVLDEKEEVPVSTPSPAQAPPGGDDPPPNGPGGNGGVDPDDLGQPGVPGGIPLVPSAFLAAIGIDGIRKLGGANNVIKIIRNGLNSTLESLQYVKNLDPTGNIDPKLQHTIVEHLDRLKQQRNREERKDRFPTRKIELTPEEREEIERTNIDIKSFRSVDNEPDAGDLRPSFYELGLEYNYQSPKDAKAEALKFARFNHVRPGFGNGEDNPLYLQNREWNDKVRFVKNPKPFIQDVTSSSLLYHRIANSSINVLLFNPDVRYKEMPFRNIHDDRASFKPTTETVIKTEISRQYPIDTNYNRFRRSNNVIYPTRGTAEPFNPLPEKKLASTSIYQTGISPYSFYFP